jgi:hypothetical protein
MPYELRDGYIIVEINKCNCKIKRLPQRRRPGEQLLAYVDYQA